MRRRMGRTATWHSEKDQWILITSYPTWPTTRAESVPSQRASPTTRHAGNPIRPPARRGTGGFPGSSGPGAPSARRTLAWHRPRGLGHGARIQRTRPQRIPGELSGSSRGVARLAAGAIVAGLGSDLRCPIWAHLGRGHIRLLGGARFDAHAPARRVTLDPYDASRSAAQSGLCRVLVIGDQFRKLEKREQTGRDCNG